MDSLASLKFKRKQGELILFLIKIRAVLFAGTIDLIDGRSL